MTETRRLRVNGRLRSLIPLMMLMGLAGGCSTAEAPSGPSPCSLDAACGVGEVCDKVAQICVPAARSSADATVPVPDATEPPSDSGGPDTAPEPTVDADTVEPTPDAESPSCEDGAPGCPCQTSADCSGDFCVTHEDGKICSVACSASNECPTGLTCLPTGSKEPSLPAHICLSPDAKLCQPCANDADCVSADGGLAVSRCLDYGEAGHFCGSSCAETGLCQDGYTCEATTSADGVNGSQCVRDDATCTCSDLSRLLGLSTPCASSHDGAVCLGSRFCGPSGLTDCDAGEPTDEVCDGQDNDCDGEADESTCDDGNPCTVDACDAETTACVHENLVDGASCDADGDGCTAGDACQLGTCTVGPPVDCGAPTTCTTYACESQGPDQHVCNTAHAGQETTCDDGVACTDDDSCDGSGGCAGAPVTCSAQAGPCRVGTCDEEAGGCVFVDLADDTPCDADANGCTVGDTCSAGFCLPGALADCSAYDDGCLAGKCETTSAVDYQCITANADLGAPCDNGDYCTVDDTCDGAGSCTQGTPRDCNAAVGDACNVGYCDNSSQICVQSKKANGSPCEDDDICTLSSTCTNGLCLGVEDVCVDERLDVNAQGVNRPTAVSLGYGRYAVQWTGDGGNHVRISDGNGSREDEEVAVGGGSSPTWSSTIAASNTGEVTTFYRNFSEAGCHEPNGACCCVGWVCPVSCWYNATLGALKLGNANTQTSADIHGMNIGTKMACWKDEPPTDGNMKMSTVTYADQTMGMILSWDPVWVWHDNVCEKTTDYLNFSSIYYMTLTADLEAGAAQEMIPSSAASGATTLNSVLLPDGTDRILVSFTDPTRQAVRLQTFQKGGAPDALDYWELVEPGTGQEVHDIQVAAFVNGLFLAVWDADGIDGDGRGIKGQRLYPDGTPVGTVFNVNVATQGDQRLGGVGVFSDGSFVVVYDDAKGDAVGWGVKARLYSSEGDPQNEITVNTLQNGDQLRPTVVTLSNDQWVVVFLDDQKRVWSRGFYKDGTPAPGVPERRANVTTAGSQGAGSAAQASDGTVLVVYESPIPGKEDGEIMARLMLPNGEVQEDNQSDEFQVNSVTAKAQTNPTAAGGPGRFVVVWQSLGEDGALDGIFASVMDTAGLPIGAPFQVNATWESYQRSPHVAMDADGKFAVVWNGYSSLAGAASDVYIRIFDENTGQIAEETVVNVTKEGAQDAPQVAKIPNGNEWVVTWQSEGQDGSGDGIYLRKVSSAGAFTSGEILVNQTVNEDQAQPTVTVSADGNNIAVCWETSGQDAPETWGIACTVLDSETLAVTVPEFLVNGYFEGHQRDPSAIYLPSGDLVVAWDTTEVDGDERGVQYRKMGADVGAPGTRILGNRTWSGDQYAPFLVATETGDFWLGWESDGQDGDGTGVTYRVIPGI